MKAEIAEAYPGEHVLNKYRVRVNGHEHCFTTPQAAEDFCEACGYEFEYVPFFTEQLRGPSGRQTE